MVFKLKSIFTFLFALCLLNVSAQDGDRGEAFEELLEIIGEENESDTDLDEIIQTLQNLKKKPINLNKATSKELYETRLFSPEQIDALILHRKIAGDIVSLYELQSINYFDLAFINRIKPFVTVKRAIDDVNVNFGKLAFSGRHTVLLRYQQILQEKKGFKFFPVDTCTDTLNCPETKAYLGSPQKLYARYRYKYNTNISYGITAEKDEGEEFFKGNQAQGFDFYSAHFYLRDYGPFKYLALGDYELKFGQGLTMWSGIGFRKSSFVLQTKRQGFSVKPYTSVNEFLFRRGVAAAIDVGDIEVTAFASYKAIDGNITQVDTLNEDTDEVSSFQETGFHRTESEIEDKGALNEFMTGAHLAYQKRDLEIGLTGFYSKYSADLNRNVQAYNQFRFNGNELINASVDYRYLLNNFHFFGETAINDNGGFGTLNGVIAALDRKISCSIVHRYFNAAYDAFYAQAFTESSEPNNEAGLYAGVKISPSQKWSIDTYADFYKHPWLRFAADAPSNGRDYLAKVTYKPKRGTELYFRYRNETKLENFRDDFSGLDALQERNLSSIRFHARYKVNKEISFKSRFEMNYFTEGNLPTTNGYLIYQDVDVQPWNFPVQFSTRFALFNTETFDNRIYTYEKDVLYSFSIPAFSGNGYRFYFNTRWTIRKGMDLWLRYSQTNFRNADQLFVFEGIGTGNDLIDGNKVERVKAQLRFQF